MPGHFGLNFNNGMSVYQQYSLLIGNNKGNAETEKTEQTEQTQQGNNDAYVPKDEYETLDLLAQLHNPFVTPDNDVVVDDDGEPKDDTVDENGEVPDENGEEEGDEGEGKEDDTEQGSEGATYRPFFRKPGTGFSQFSAVKTDSK